MNNRNRILSLKLESSKNKDQNEGSVLPDMTNSLGKASMVIDGSSPNLKGQQTISDVYNFGNGGFHASGSSSYMLQSQHQHCQDIPLSNIKGNTLSDFESIYKLDYSLFLSAEQLSTNKPPGLLNWIDRQYAKAQKGQFEEGKMRTFVGQAKKLIKRAYDTGEVWEIDWFQHPDVSIFNRGKHSGQLVCEKKQASVRNKSNGSYESNIAIQPPDSSSCRFSSLNSSTNFGFSLHVSRQQAKTSLRQIQKKALSEKDKRRLRLERFASTSSSRKTKLDEDEDYSNLNATSNHSYKFDRNKPVVGRCTILEKRYLRLTSEPNPMDVRPLNVLKNAYHYIMNKFRKEGFSYSYLCDQLKSMRQDLKVQIIENDFTLKVYQTHAKIALENGDLGEYNQCQGGINELFQSGKVQKKNFEEFISYRIMYHLLTEDHPAINEIRLQLYINDAMLNEHPMIKLALNMATAQFQQDYHTFMKLYHNTEGPMRCLVNEFIKRERLRALRAMCTAYNQLRLTFLVSELGLENEDETFQFLNDFDLFNSVVLPEGDADTMYLNFKECRSIIMNHYNKSMKIDIKGQK